MNRIKTVNVASFTSKSIPSVEPGNIWLSILDDNRNKADQKNANTDNNINLNEDLPLQILIAEDQLTDRTVAMRILQSMGYMVDFAVNGLEALQALRQKHYDVLLTDVQMPQMGGLEVARHICQEWTLEERPCMIAVTSEAMPEIREQCLNLGMDECLSKPLDVNQLVQALRKCRFRSLPDESDDRI